MQHPDLLTQNYDYTLPEALIATKPVYPRDNAKLLVYDRKNDTIIHTAFAHLLEYVPQHCAVFLNDTRVIKARIFGHKAKVAQQGGGKVELLFNKSLDAFRSLAMIRGKVAVGIKLHFEENLVATVEELHEDGMRTVTFTQYDTPLRFEELVLILDRIGHLPLPPYMQREDNKEDETDYQTLFAKEAGAVAAPTASLHFTPELLEHMKQKHPAYTLTLHVGAGTFKPVEHEHILEHPMHSEYFHIGQEAAHVLDGKTPLLAVGTTVTRTIEYYVRTGKTDGECDLFLNPSNPPRRVTHLLTNFHLPKSTLIMLVSSFIGREKTLQLYKEAIENNYRFFSYGDAMLIL